MFAYASSPFLQAALPSMRALLGDQAASLSADPMVAFPLLEQLNEFPCSIFSRGRLVYSAVGQFTSPFEKMTQAAYFFRMAGRRLPEVFHGNLVTSGSEEAPPFFRLRLLAGQAGVKADHLPVLGLWHFTGGAFSVAPYLLIDAFLEKGKPAKDGWHPYVRVASAHLKSFEHAVRDLGWYKELTPVRPLEKKPEEEIGDAELRCAWEVTKITFGLIGTASRFKKELPMFCYGVDSILRKNGITTTRQLVTLSEERVLAIKGIGPKYLKHIRDTLEFCELKLGMTELEIARWMTRGEDDTPLRNKFLGRVRHL